MTNETVKALLMLALILGIQASIYAPRIQDVWRRALQVIPVRRNVR